jgi:hypothetical protein
MRLRLSLPAKGRDIGRLFVLESYAKKQALTATPRAMVCIELEAQGKREVEEKALIERTASDASITGLRMEGKEGMLITEGSAQTKPRQEMEICTQARFKATAKEAGKVSGGSEIARSKDQMVSDIGKEAKAFVDSPIQSRFETQGVVSGIGQLQSRLLEGWGVERKAALGVADGDHQGDGVERDAPAQAEMKLMGVGGYLFSFGATGLQAKGIRKIGNKADVSERALGKVRRREPLQAQDRRKGEGEAVRGKLAKDIVVVGEIAAEEAQAKGDEEG